MGYRFNGDTVSYQIEVPFSSIKCVHSSPDDDEHSGKSMALVVELLQLPLFYKDNRSIYTRAIFVPCDDFTTSQQASKILLHYLGGVPRELGQLLTSKFPAVDSHNLLGQQTEEDDENLSISDDSDLDKPLFPVRSVKVYDLELRTLYWIQIGSGECDWGLKYNPVSKYMDMFIFVRSEDDSSQLLFGAYIEDQFAFRRDQDTLIKWKDPSSNSEITLSFPNTKICARVWTKIHYVQNRLTQREMERNTNNSYSGLDLPWVVPRQMARVLETPDSYRVDMEAGHCVAFIFPSTTNGQVEGGILVQSDHDPQRILFRAIIKQQNNPTTWGEGFSVNEDSNNELWWQDPVTNVWMLLGFQEIEGCKLIWDFISKYQDPESGDGTAGRLSPVPKASKNSRETSEIAPEPRSVGELLDMSESRGNEEDNVDMAASSARVRESAAVDKPEAGDETEKRLKVYELRGTDWIETGSGFCKMYFGARGIPYVTAWDDAQHTIFEANVLTPSAFKKKQDTAIQWKDPSSAIEKTLSFQTAEGCTEVWNFISNIRNIHESPEDVVEFAPSNETSNERFSTNTSTETKVSVYELQGHDWIELGFGICSTVFKASNYRDPSIIVQSMDATQGVLFKEDVVPGFAFKKEQDTSIKWKDPTSDAEKTLSFQSAEACTNVWHFINITQDPPSVVDIKRVERTFPPEFDGHPSKERAQNYILQYFAMLSNRRKEFHEQRLHSMSETASHHSNQRLRPSEIATKEADLMRVLDEDWKLSMQQYPKVLEYLHSLGDETRELSTSESSALSEIMKNVNSQENTTGEDEKVSRAHRVKVYELRDEGQMERGTGYCIAFQWQPRISVQSEFNRELVLFEARIGQPNKFWKQNDTIINWTDPVTNVKITLSFADPEGCTQIWDTIMRFRDLPNEREEAQAQVEHHLSSEKEDEEESSADSLDMFERRGNEEYNEDMPASSTSGIGAKRRELQTRSLELYDERLPALKEQYPNGIPPDVEREHRESCIADARKMVQSLVEANQVSRTPMKISEEINKETQESMPSEFSKTMGKGRPSRLYCQVSLVSNQQTF